MAWISPEQGWGAAVKMYSLGAFLTLSHFTCRFTTSDTMGHTCSLRFALPTVPVTTGYG